MAQGDSLEQKALGSAERDVSRLDRFWGEKTDGGPGATDVEVG